MTPAATPTSAAPPEDPIRAALDDLATRADLLNHALAILGRWLPHRPLTERNDLAREAFQETSLRAIQKCCDYQPAAGTVRGWLHGILNKVLLQIGRSLRRQPVQPPDNLAEWECLAADLSPTADAIVADRLDGAGIMARLPGEHRTILHLRYYEKLEYDEIAARLRISRGCARVRVCRALGAAKALAGVAPGEDGR
jgi:RNA polymerase sigma-70 factor (ECF subfamily)